MTVITSRPTNYTTGGEKKRNVEFTVELREWLQQFHQIGILFFDTLDTMRLITVHDAGQVMGCFENYSIYTYDETDSTPDDGNNVIRPINVDTLSSGRWLLRARFDGGSIELKFYDSFALFPEVGNPNWFYIDKQYSRLYRWNVTTEEYLPITVSYAVDSGTLGGQQPSFYKDVLQVNALPLNSQSTAVIYELMQQDGAKAPYTLWAWDGAQWHSVGGLVAETDPVFQQWLLDHPDLVQDANYVHTDNNYTNADASKLNGIEAGAQVNIIEEVQVNGAPLAVTNKSVDITVPTQPSDIGAQPAGDYLLEDTGLQTAEAPTDTSLFSWWNGTSRVKSTLLEIWNVLKLKADALYVSVALRFEKHTGFYSENDPRNKKILVTYNGDKTITLSRSDGTFQAYFEGLPIAGLTNGHTSTAIPATTPTGLWFYYYNGSTLAWSQTPFLFSHCMITIAYFRADGTFLFVVPETHGFMPESTHEELHKAIGAYGYSGNGVSGYTPNSTTATNRRPTFEAGVIADEDKFTDLALMNGNYTSSWITSGGSITSDWNNTEIIPLTGTQPIINVITNGAGSQVPITNNNYCAIFVFKIACGADADSQRYRCVILQPQHQGTLTQMQAVNYTSVNINGLTGISNEIIFTQKIIVRYTANNWSITSIENISGNARFSVISSGATAGVNELNVSMDARTHLTGTTLDANADIIDSYITNHKPFLTSGHTGNPDKIFGTDGSGVAKEYTQESLQTQNATSNATSGTVTLAKQTVTTLTTTLTNAHTLTIIPELPTVFTNRNYSEVVLTVGATAPAITWSAPSGVTFTWKGGAPTGLEVNKKHSIMYDWESATSCIIRREQI